jgi:O-antigen/teichoic acid export membrane protein
MLAAILLGIVMVVLVAGGPALVEHLFDDQVLLLIGLAIGLVGTAAGHLTRGACSGQGRFRPYAVFLGADGVIRLALCAALAVIGVETAGWFGVALGASPAIAVVVALFRERGLVVEGPEAGWGEVSKALLALLLGSILSFTLINGSPIAIQILGDEADKADAGRFVNGLLIARVPLFLFQAVQASLLPKLSALAGAARFDEFRSGLKNLLVVTVGLGALASVGAFAVGPQVVTAMFGDEFELDHRTLGLLALGCALYMIATALAQAVIALAGHRLVAASWAAGVVAFVGTVAFASDDLFFRVELGLLAGSLASMVAMGLALAARLSSGAQPEAGAVIDALHDLPFEP